MARVQSIVKQNGGLYDIIHDGSLTVEFDLYGSLEENQIIIFNYPKAKQVPPIKRIKFGRGPHKTTEKIDGPFTLGFSGVYINHVYVNTGTGTEVIKRQPKTIMAPKPRKTKIKTPFRLPPKSKKTKGVRDTPRVTIIPKPKEAKKEPTIIIPKKSKKFPEKEKIAEPKVEEIEELVEVEGNELIEISGPVEEEIEEIEIVVEEEIEEEAEEEEEEVEEEETEEIVVEEEDEVIEVEEIEEEELVEDEVEDEVEEEEEIDEEEEEEEVEEEVVEELEEIDYETATYRQLQTVAKAFGISAGGGTEVLRARVISAVEKASLEK